MFMQLKDLNFSYGTEKILENINIIINDNDHVGITGVNGAGKSTLFKLMMQELNPDSGKIIIKHASRVKLLPQVINDEIPNMDITVFDYLLLARPIEKLNKTLIETYNKISLEQDTNKQKQLLKKAEKIENELEYWEQYTAEGTLLKIISGMNITDEMLYKKLNNLSGGQKSKIAFAKLLYSRPEIILLDEPTNHLDVDAKEELKRALQEYKGSILLICHEPEFYRDVVTQVWNCQDWSTKIF